MSYSRYKNILNILPLAPQTSTSNGWTSTVNTIDRHIKRADALINGYIASRYDVSNFCTIGSVPPLIELLSEDISTYYLMRSEFSNDNQNVNEWVEKYEDAIETLKDLSKGELNLTDKDGNLIDTNETSTIGIIQGTTDNFSPTFDEGDVLNWKVSNDKLSDIEDNKN